MLCYNKLLLGGTVIRMSDPLRNKLVLAHGGDLNGNNFIISHNPQNRLTYKRNLDFFSENYAEIHSFYLIFHVISMIFAMMTGQMLLQSVFGCFLVSALPLCTALLLVS